MGDEIEDNKNRKKKERWAASGVSQCFGWVNGLEGVVWQRILRSASQTLDKL